MRWAERDIAESGKTLVAMLPTEILRFRRRRNSASRNSNWNENPEEGSPFESESLVKEVYCQLVVCYS